MTAVDFSMANILGLNRGASPDVDLSEPPRNRRRRCRTLFSDDALAHLEAYFETNHYPDIYQREKLAEQIDVTEARVQVWFQNHRSRLRRHMASTTRGSSLDGTNSCGSSPSSTSSDTSPAPRKSSKGTKQRTKPAPLVSRHQSPDQLPSAGAPSSPYLSPYPMIQANYGMYYPFPVYGTSPYGSPLSPSWPSPISSTGSPNAMFRGLYPFPPSMLSPIHTPSPLRHVNFQFPDKTQMTAYPESTSVSYPVNTNMTSSPLPLIVRPKVPSPLPGCSIPGFHETEERTSDAEEQRGKTTWYTPEEIDSDAEDDKIDVTSN